MSYQFREPTTATLSHGQTVVIRPLEEQDRQPMLAFGEGLPPDDLLYLEEDLRSPETITRLVNARFAENWRQLVAIADGSIVGYSAVRRLPGWSNHVGDILLVVGEGWRRSGLGLALAQAIFDAARDLGVDKVIAEMLDEQTGGRAIFGRLGFCVEGTLSDHARDRAGVRHDLLVLAYHIR